MKLNGRGANLFRSIGTDLVAKMSQRALQNAIKSAMPVRHRKAGRSLCTIKKAPFSSKFAIEAKFWQKKISLSGFRLQGFE
jgi:hypothetical protein